jgi:hypothetical protein
MESLQWIFDKGIGFSPQTGNNLSFDIVKREQSVQETSIYSSSSAAGK